MGTATSRVPLTQSHTPAARDHDQAHGNLEPALDDLALPVGDSPLVFGNQALGLASASAPPQDTTGSNSQPPLPDPNPPHPTSPDLSRALRPPANAHLLRETQSSDQNRSAELVL
ncbi:hypothetical protein MJO28_011913 [Puccinia striiformis f. sp. tritici]|uniref:Uncharacterized protein n=2 Tax=Puccinia striiformis TaxID=27350 RepID=A0A2S4UXF1_9BASI|nr:hypothetical protein MJO28_011913 [Puccinia striiformis f. sp. tritici]KAI7947142.1 hypothetical protein MJO29_011669 [Puccinia striiformis f. sp. tritici]POW01911.1 hypothetical protein PSTT_12193 [Puccinia striiformis]